MRDAAISIGVCGISTNRLNKMRTFSGICGLPGVTFRVGDQKARPSLDPCPARQLVTSFPGHASPLQAHPHASNRSALPPTGARGRERLWRRPVVSLSSSRSPKARLLPAVSEDTPASGPPLRVPRPPQPRGLSPAHRPLSKRMAGSGGPVLPPFLGVLPQPSRPPQTADAQDSKLLTSLRRCSGPS